MITITVSNIVYDTRIDDTDMRDTIPAVDLPPKLTVMLDSEAFEFYADRDPAMLGNTVLKHIEGDWCVDGFDYQITRPVKLRSYSVNCKVREEGEPSWEEKFMAMMAARAVD